MSIDRNVDGSVTGGARAESSGPIPTSPGALHVLPVRLGRYTLTKRLGVGGMAEVFLAQQDGPAGFQKTCVVKKILPHLAVEPRFVTMFQREARVAALLQHTNVVQTFELGEEEGIYYIAMEYVDGPPLHHLARAAWRAGRSLPLELIGCALHDAALGLSAAHSLVDNDGKPMKLVHRDISPDNLIINREGITKILDFGVAKIDSSERTATGELKGKLPFLSPEQIRGDVVDERVDLYALGVTGYWLLTGTRPFTGVSDLNLMQTILAEQPRPTRELNENVPPELDALILRLLAKDPADRPASAALVADALSATTNSRRSVVAPFVKQLVTMVGQPPLESSPREAGLSAAMPVSGTFAIACQQIPEFVGAIPERPQLKHALPDLASATHPTSPSPGPLDTEFPDDGSEEVPLTSLATRALVPSALRKRQGSRIAAAAGVAILALVGVALAWPREGGRAVVQPATADAGVAIAQGPGAPSDQPTGPQATGPQATGPHAASGTPPVDVASGSATPDAGVDVAVAATAQTPSQATPAHATARSKLREVEATAPRNIQWLDLRGRLLGTGTTRLKLGANDKRIVAVDKLRGGRTPVTVSGASVDYAALPRGKLQVRANPYADVTLGKEALGTTPFQPVDVVAGTYTVKFVYNGREETRTVEVGAGATARAAVDFGG